jgi:hypothetical protein
MTTPVYANGVLDLRRSEVIPQLRMNFVVGDTFIRVIGIKEIGADYTGCTASISLYDAKQPAGVLVYSDVTIPMHDVVVPATAEDMGSASFSIVIPAPITTTLGTKPTLYGPCRLLRPDGSISTIFSIQAYTVYT